MPATNGTERVNGTLSPATAMDKPTSSTGSGRIEDEEVKPYVLAGELGKGSFAVVYRGYHEVSKVFNTTRS